MSSDPKKAMGIVGARLVVADEPGAWTLLGGQAMYDAIQNRAGQNQMTVCYLGTIAPDPAENWWTNLVKAGSSEGNARHAVAGHAGRVGRLAHDCDVQPLGPDQSAPETHPAPGTRRGQA